MTEKTKVIDYDKIDRTLAIDDGGPAFPVIDPSVTNPYLLASGLSIRDYFAGQALIGLITNPVSVSVQAPITLRAYELADAMIAARK